MARFSIARSIRYSMVQVRNRDFCFRVEFTKALSTSDCGYDVAEYCFMGVTYHFASEKNIQEQLDCNPAR